MSSEVFIRGVAKEHTAKCGVPGFNWCQGCLDELTRLCAAFWKTWETDHAVAAFWNHGRA